VITVITSVLFNQPQDYSMLGWTSIGLPKKNLWGLPTRLVLLICVKRQ